MQELFKSETLPDKAQEQIKAIKLLASQGYTIIDLEGHFINKWNLDHRQKPNITYNRVPKLQQY
jgi:hypothetical protein|tara:strand:- start:771 stop:962 length:192 start_codon:yes stop_codon:yes gene_type:complete